MITTEHHSSSGIYATILKAGITDLVSQVCMVAPILTSHKLERFKIFLFYTNNFVINNSGSMCVFYDI